MNFLKPLPYVSCVLQTSKYAAVSQMYLLMKMLLDVFEIPIEDETVHGIGKVIYQNLKKDGVHLMQV